MYKSYAKLPYETFAISVKIIKICIFFIFLFFYFFIFFIFFIFYFLFFSRIHIHAPEIW